MVGLDNPLKVILVDKNTGRSAILRRALQDKGHEVICRLENSIDLSLSNEITHADVIIVNTDIPNDEIFANLSAVNRVKPKPIVMFTQEAHQNMASSAVKSGVSAFIVDGLEANRVQGIIDTALARFREYQALKDELDNAKLKLDERKDVEKAKGLLMQHKGLNEQEAYNTLRKMAMDSNKKIGQVANNIIDVLSLLNE
jgi:two-component system, response regulator / RNA-binding antiterminator